MSDSLKGLGKLAMILGVGGTVVGGFSAGAFDETNNLGPAYQTLEESSYPWLQTAGYTVSVGLALHAINLAVNELNRHRVDKQTTIGYALGNGLMSSVAISAGVFGLYDDFTNPNVSSMEIIDDAVVHSSVGLAGMGLLTYAVGQGLQNKK